MEKSQPFASTVASRVIYFVVAVFLGTFILRFAMSRNFGRKPRFVPGTNVSPQPSYALASGVVVIAYLLTHGIIELLRYIVFPAMGFTFLNGGVGNFFSIVILGFIVNVIVYSRLLKYPENGPIGFKSACYVSLVVYMVWAAVFILAGVVLIFIGIFSRLGW